MSWWVWSAPQPTAAIANRPRNSCGIWRLKRQIGLPRRQADLFALICDQARLLHFEERADSRAVAQRHRHAVAHPDCEPALVELEVVDELPRAGVVPERCPSGRVALDF